MLPDASIQGVWRPRRVLYHAAVTTNAGDSPEHRPYPRHTRAWNMAMRWHDLLFAHWAVQPESLTDHLPPGLELDAFDGLGWLGVVPFRMSGVRLRCTPSLPGLSAFPELNLRTYVTDGGRPGVWFFSLDATNPLAVRLARRGFYLPYRHAEMSCERRDDWVTYTSRRTDRLGPAVRFEGRYRPIGPVTTPLPGSLDDWLTSRYCLYAADARGRLYRGEIDHASWPLQPAEAEIEVNTIARTIDLTLDGPPRTLHYAHFLDVTAWTLDRVTRR